VGLELGRPCDQYPKQNRRQPDLGFRAAMKKSTLDRGAFLFE
jgi:hypothetical protein